MPDIARKFFAGSIQKDDTLGPRQIRVIASDGTIDRAKDIMVASGCILDNYNNNNIVLADHDRKAPVGNADLQIEQGRVAGIITFAPVGISPKADEYCGLAKAGVIKAVSVGFDPIEAEPRKGGGFLYKQWELMELSVLGGPPCNPNALIIGRSIDQPEPQPEAQKSEWKVGASRNLPVADIATEKQHGERIVKDAAGNLAWARKGFLIYDTKKADHTAFNLAFADVVDGRLTVTRSSLAQASRDLDAFDLPAEIKDKARAVLKHYEAKMGKGTTASKKKGLYEVAQLASALSNLGYIHDNAVWEAEVEQDASKLPAMLAAVLSQAAAALVAMTQEETTELLEGRGIEVMPIDVEYVEAGASPQIKALRGAFRKAGRVMSQANMDHIAAVHKCVGKMLDCHQKMADAHDDVHEQLEQMMDHGTSAGDHLKALMKSAGVKPEDAEDDDDPDDEADHELAGPAGERKRMADLLALNKAN